MVGIQDSIRRRCPLMTGYFFRLAGKHGFQKFYYQIVLIMKLVPTKIDMSPANWIASHPFIHKCDIVDRFLEVGCASVNR